METASPRFSVSDFIAVANQTFEYALGAVEIEGEVASFKVNQNKYVFFDLKDASGSIGCFMTVWQLRIPIEDGMRVVIKGTPKLTNWGKFSVTVQAIQPSGEGSIKKSFELLKAKLQKEGLFAPERKRILPQEPQSIAVISSTQAAGYADFIKILNDRWGGLRVRVANVQVQGVGAADQIIRALRYFNEQEVLPEAIVIVRGGGSADDLRVFNDELLVREIAASRVPTLVGVGHEVDVSLADMVADVRAATPSNAAQLLVPDKQEIVRQYRHKVSRLPLRLAQEIDRQQGQTKQKLERVLLHIDRSVRDHEQQLSTLRRALTSVDPRNVLARGYALVRGVAALGKSITIEKSDILITAEVTHVDKK